MNPITARAFASEIEKLANGDMIDFLQRKRRGHLTPSEKRRAELAKEASELLKEAGLGNQAVRAAYKTKNFISSRARWVGEDLGGIVRDAGRPVESLRNAWGHKDNNGLNKALLGAGTFFGAKSALSRTDPEGKDRSRVERAGRLVGGTVGGLLSLPHMRGLAGLPAGMIAGTVGERIGGGVGKAIDHVRGYKSKSQPTSSGPSQVATAPY